MGLELLAEAGNYAAVQRIYSPYGWPYPPQPSSAAAAAAAAAALSPAAASVDLYYRQAAAAAALQKPLAYRLYPPGLPILPHVSSEPLRDALRPEAIRPELLRPELRPDSLRPDLLKADGGKLEGRLEGRLEGHLEGRLEGRLFPLVSSPPPREQDEGDIPHLGDAIGGRPLSSVLRSPGSPNSPSHCPSPTDLRVRVTPDPPSDPHKSSH